MYSSANSSPNTNVPGKNTHTQDVGTPKGVSPAAKEAQIPNPAMVSPRKCVSPFSYFDI